MSADSSGSGKPDDGSSPGEMSSSTPEAGEVTGGKVDNACNSQAHSTPHCPQSETNQDLTGESDMSTPAQAQSKGETSKNDGKLADDKEKGEKIKITSIEQTEKPDLIETNIQSVEKVLENTEEVFVAVDAMQGKDNIPSSKNYHEQHFHEEKGKVLQAKPAADQHYGQYNSSRNIHRKEVSTDVLSTLQAGNPNLGDVTTTSQSDNLNQVYYKTTSQASNLNLGDGPTASQTDNSNLGDGITILQANNSNLGDYPVSSQPNNSNLGDGPISSQTNNLNLGDGPTPLQANNSNQGDGTTILQTNNSNLGDGPITSQANNSNLGDGPTILQTNKLNLGDITSPTSQANNSNQGDGPTPSQANNSNQGDGPTPSQADNSNQGDGTTILQANNSNLGDITSPTSQADNSNQGDGMTNSLQADNLNQTQGNNPNQKQAENSEKSDGMTSLLGNWENTNRGGADNTKKVENYELSELQAGNLHKQNLPQSSNHMTDYASCQSEEGTTPTEHPHIPFLSSQSRDDFTVIEYQFEQIIDEILDDGTLNENKEEWKKKSKKKIKGFFLTKVEDGTLSQRSFHPNVTHIMPLQNVDTERVETCAKNAREARRKQGDEDGTSPTSHTQSYRKTRKASNPIADGASFSKSSLPRIPNDHEILHIQWNMEQEIKGNEPIEIALYHGKRIKYVIQIRCMAEDFYRLKFMFCNANTFEDLSKSLLEIDCTLKSGTNEVHLGSKIFLDKSEIIRDKIEGVINNVKATSKLQVHCAETSIAEDKLVEKCEEFSSEFKRGNIAVYGKGKHVWIVGRNNEELDVLEKRLIEDNVLQKASYSSKDSRGCTTIDEAKHEENLRRPSGQMTLPDSSETMDAKSLHDPSKHTTVPHDDVQFIDDDKNHQGPVQTTPPLTESSQTVTANSVHESSTRTDKNKDVAMLLNSSLSGTTSKSLSSGGSYKKSSVKTKSTDMTEMTKVQVTSSDPQQTYNNQLLPQTKSTSRVNTKGEVKHNTVLEGEKNEKKIVIKVQLGEKEIEEIALPFDTNYYFKWLYCLSDSCCLATLQKACQIEGVDMQMLNSQHPVFKFPANANDVACIELLQQSLIETVKQHDIVYCIFDRDLVRPEKDMIRFCNDWNDTKKESHVSLLMAKSYGGIALCLVGERPDIESMKPHVESELKRYRNIQIEEAVELCTFNYKLDDTCIKIFEKMKEKLEKDFQVTVSFESNSEIRFMATSQDAITRVIGKVDEISESVQSLKLRYEYLEFLNRSESARLYLEQQLRKRKILKLHFIENDEYDTVQVFQEKNTDSEDVDVNKTIQNWLFCIPSTDELCQIFSFEEGRKEFSRLVEENKGKVQMVLDGSKQPCCVGTMDVREKTKNTLSRFRLKNDHVKLPSEEVWQFCARHHMFQDIAKEASSEVKFAENKKYQWCVEIRGPEAFISKCCDKIEKEIRKVKSETIFSIDYDSFNESTVANLIQKWNAEKRCFVNTKCVKAKAPAPWKKWIEKNEMVVKMTYSVNFNSSPEMQDNELKLVLIPEEQTGAKSKNLCVPMPGQSIAQISVPSSKTKDFVERGLKEVLKMNKEQWKKRHLIVDCERIPEKELKNSMTIICYTLDNTAGSESCITMCEFCDTRLEMFDCMTKLIDAYMKKKHFQVLEWKGRSIEMDVKTGQMAQQKDFDVLVNSTSWNLDLTAGLTSRSLLKAAGPGIQQECKKNYRGGIYKGEIAVTEGHNLNCRHVFHGFLPPYSTTENFQSLRRMIRTCLETADKMKMESIAFPALGTGNLGYDRRDVANVLFDEVEKYEKEVRLGSLSRLCCVIYQDDIDAVEIFQKRYLKWNEDHKWQNTSKEVVVTSDKSDVIEEFYQAFQQLKCSTATNLEPPIAEITKNMRLGNPPTEDPKNSHAKKQIQQSRQNADYSSEEKRCLLIKTEENSEKEHLNVWERNLRKDFENLAENIVCPFNSPNVALVQFASKKDVEDISNDDNFKKKYNLQKFPPQAVVGLEAVISPRMTELLKKKSVTAEVIRSKSGALLLKNDTNALVLRGNILEIKAAHNFFATLMKEGSHGITQEERPVSKAAENIIRENLSEMHDVSNVDNATNGKSMSGDDSKKYSLKNPPVTGINEFSKSRQIPSTVAKLEKPKVLEDIQCSDEDATKLKYFHKNLMTNVEIITVSNQSVVALQFHDEGTKRRVEEYLDKLKHMPRATCPLPKIAEITKTVATKCSDDTFCYISSDRQQIEIIGIKRDNVNKIKEELNMLSKPEIQMTEKPDESSKMPVLVTNEGVSVFVYCASLLDLQTPVDAIVCPLSKLSDLEYGLPKYIAETTRSEHDRELKKIFESNGNIFPDLSVIQFRTKNIKSCKYVVYVSTHRTQLRERDNDLVACEQFLLELMLQIFVKVEKYGIQKIAIPAVCSGKNGFTKEICAQCYGTSVMKYSRTIQFDAQGLSEIHFVDKSAEMILYIESVFTQPDLVDTFEAKAQDLGQPSSNDQSLYPYSAEDGTFCLSENRCLTVIDSNDLRQHQKDRTLVYQDILSKMDKWKVITDLIPEEDKKQLKKSKHVAFFTNGLITSNFDYIMLPILEKKMDLDEFKQRLSSFYFSIFQEAEKQQIIKMIIPLYGFSKGHDRVTPICARCLSQELKKFHTRPSPKSTRLDVVVAVDDKPTKDSVMKEIRILIESERAGFWQIAGNPNRSHKRTKQMHKLHKQPNGRISLKTTETRLKDFKCRTIEIQVTIPDGIQESFHPNPGKSFIGRKETLFLPDNDLGRSFASMIRKAFKQKILYEVKTNTTQGIEMVVGNDTYLISKRENFPDPKQLQNLHGIFKKKVES